MKTYLNLGCGKRYHNSWTNIDFVSTSESVQAHNLLSGIPFIDESFEVVYHSHVLEHFSNKDGRKFLQECYRVLKINGIIRIAVPDLEQIAREYLKNLSLALENDIQAQQNYEWIILEMYDQVVRTQSGGNMVEYITQDEIPNEDYVFGRIGEEGRNIRKVYLTNKNITKQPPIPEKDKRSFLGKFLGKIKNELKIFLFKDEIKFYEENLRYTQLGKFRLRGEIHQWMYDRYSLSKLLKDIGFKDIAIKSAFESRILNWQSFELDSKSGIIFKPDSLFIEAIK
jgi:predicted SAM-dependent methyltransferase